MDDLEKEDFCLPQMDWNSRFVVKVNGGAWLPVVGWNHYPYSFTRKTNPLVCGYSELGPFEEVEVAKHSVEYKIVTNADDWATFLREHS